MDDRIDLTPRQRELLELLRRGKGVPRKPMTPVPWAPVYDFVDLGIQVLEDHSAARAAEYHRHPAFRVRRVPADLFGGEP